MGGRHTPVGLIAPGIVIHILQDQSASLYQTTLLIHKFFVLHLGYPFLKIEYVESFSILFESGDRNAGQDPL